MRETLHCGFEYVTGQYTDFFALCIEQKWIDRQELISEINDALANKDTDWVSLAIEENLLWPPKEEYLDEDVINYFKAITWEVLYPEKHLTQSEIELLRYDTLCILRDAAQTGEGWLSVEEIIQRLRGKRSRWEVLEPYHFLDHFQEFITSGNHFLEKTGKRPLEIGLLRITPKGVNYLEKWMQKRYDKTHPDAVKQP